MARSPSPAGIGGMEDRKVESQSYTPRKAPARFRLPNHNYTRPSAMRMDAQSINFHRLPKFSAAELGRLPNGTAFVVSKGRELKTYTKNPAEYAINNDAA